METPIQTLLSKAFPFLKKEDIDTLLSICQYKRFDNKEIIIRAGSTLRKGAFIVSGYTRGYIITSEGVEKTLILRREGTFMGVPDWLFDTQPTKYYYEAITDCELLFFNMSEIERLAKTNPHIFDLYVWGLKDNLKMLVYRIETMISLSPEERYKDLLERYPQFFEAAFDKHIANFLGITPVSLSRLIKRVKDTNAKLKKNIS